MFDYSEKFDVIVVGGGHAGCEAALSTARCGFKTLLVSSNIDNIGQMSCNPAIGGVGKGQLVKEVDALGGEMAKAIDATGIQFKKLNTKKGPAVQSSRAQADKYLYKSYIRNVIENTANLFVIQAFAEDIIVENNEIKGVVTNYGISYFCKIAIITAGTFMNALMHYGENKIKGGRAGDAASFGLSGSLERLGFEITRMKTGTPPRLDGRTISYEDLEPQWGDDSPSLFSFSETKIQQKQVPCYITYTNIITHEMIRSEISRSPMYNGSIKSIGPRYCPSIEDKIMKFPDKERHQIFLEPEGLSTNEVYVNGISTSLPIDVQLKMLKSIKGLENAKLTRPGYAVEYDCFPPTQLHATLETKIIKNLFFAGQVNGTSGYEEAAAQGMLAGINAVKSLRGEELLILNRSESYIGVMVDDLVMKGVLEPYRMFTSRAEHRLILREDNADIRLRKYGRDLGLVSDLDWNRFRNKIADIELLRSYILNAKIYPSEAVNLELEKLNGSKISRPHTIEELLKRPELTLDNIQSLPDEKAKDVLKYSSEVKSQVEIAVKYEGYISRESAVIDNLRKLDEIKVPENIRYKGLAGLSNEIIEKLERIRPDNLGQASRISGVTPSAISILLIHLKKHRSKILSNLQDGPK